MYLLIATNNNRQASLDLYDTTTKQIVATKTWACGRQLSQTLLANIKALLAGRDLDFADLTGLGVFAGPAGFTDLRITHAVANALAYGLKIPIVNAGGQAWCQNVSQRLGSGEDAKIIKPDYGRPATITRRKK